ncbi:MAG: hypothetical protein K9H16_15345 [Bacteroidales bacterium]|nr:hypothetical protein [Bacteroidales bacterium]
MKKILLAIVVASVFSISASAQIPGNAPKSGNSIKLEITPMVGYFFGGNIKLYEGKLKIRDNVSYGVIAGLPLPNGVTFEFSYIGMPSTAQWRPYFNYENQYPSRDFDLNVNYFNLGGVRNIPLSDKVKGFGAMRAGAAYFNSSAGDIDDVWRFEISLGGGLKVYLNDKIGLRFQGNMHLPLVFSGGGIFCGIGTGGSGCSVGVGSTSAIIQGDLSGGLIFRLGN